MVFLLCWLYSIKEQYQKLCLIECPMKMPLLPQQYAFHLSCNSCHDPESFLFQFECWCLTVWFLTLWKVLMVVGAGRGPLVRASLQVLMVLFFNVLRSVLNFFLCLPTIFSHSGSWRNRAKIESVCCWKKSKCSHNSPCESLLVTYFGFISQEKCYVGLL